MPGIDGIIGKKIGMTQVFTEDGKTRAVTAIEAGPCTVTQVKTVENDGYQAVQLGFEQAKKLNAPEKGHLKNLGLFKYLRELRVVNIEGVNPGDKVDVSIFKPGDRVDVTGISRGKGFAGVVKRHHFRGGPKTHGQSDRQRAPGAIGSTTSPGRVWKNLKMAGHMGNVRVTVRNLEVYSADVNKNLLLVKGAIPGGENSLVIIRKSSRGS
ncbi:MAG: 50S ribosomal protein L3 [Dehalococcoidales bacterium]|jgi:large subunit ribosomal protein L3|nr:50S ribosomal protein L3 [Dehalococcoidales bacterium]